MVCGVVACKDNNKVDRCGVSVVWLVLMIGWFVGVVWIDGVGIEN